MNRLVSYHTGATSTSNSNSSSARSPPQPLSHLQRPQRRLIRDSDEESDSGSKSNHPIDSTMVDGGNTQHFSMKLEKQDFSSSRPFPDRPLQEQQRESIVDQSLSTQRPLVTIATLEATGAQSLVSTKPIDQKAETELSSASSSSAATEIITSSSSQTGASSAPPLTALFARTAHKSLLSIDVQIRLLTSVLKHDPFNCPIRRTTQVWQQIAREQGISARTCARRYENIIQDSISGKDKYLVGTEEQIATKKTLLEQLLKMMNQPQALVRMQKRKRYRSEEEDRKLLLEVIRLNPFAQKIGQIAKAWEDVRDALGMKVHARQCVRRVNRMIKPYQLREKMYNGNIPENMREINDELIKQVIQLMYTGGHGGALEYDAEEEQSNDEDSASGESYSDDQDDRPFEDSEVNKKRKPSQNEDELEEDRNEPIASPLALPDLSSRLIMPMKKTMATAATAAMQLPLVSSSLEPTTALSLEYTPDNWPSRIPSSSSAMDLKEGPKDTTTIVIGDHRAAIRASEPEIRPQHNWGSHPYSQTPIASMPQNKESNADHHRPLKYHRIVPKEHVNAFTNEQQDYGSQRQPSQKQSFVKNPSPNESPCPIMLTPMVTSVTSSSAFTHIGQREGHEFLDPSSPLYHTIMREFCEVKACLIRLGDQRLRDKEGRKKMYTLIETLQHQVQEQQREINELQSQIQSQDDHQRRQASYRRSSPQYQPQRYQHHHHHHHRPQSQQAQQQQKAFQYEHSPPIRSIQERPLSADGTGVIREIEHDSQLPLPTALTPMMSDHHNSGSNNSGLDINSNGNSNSSRPMQDRVSMISALSYEHRSSLRGSSTTVRAVTTTSIKASGSTGKKMDEGCST
ncbi:hypothetical protein BX616_001867 [Lobosporangium transversale]|nr:hypothetical protein BX616_001867 [Lobosporangium transversale]